MSCFTRRDILLVQLPIPPLGPSPIRGNVPLAAAYLKLFAERKGLGAFYGIDILPPQQANTLGGHALVAAIALLESLFAVCQEVPTYLDHFYALQPGPAAGAKRLVVLLQASMREQVGAAWHDAVAPLAAVVWRGAAEEEEMDAHEYAWSE